MPEGGNPGEQPGTAEQQVDAQIAIDRVTQWVTGMFGNPAQHQSGGGGAGGSYSFSSLEELDAIIAQFQDEQQAIRNDGETIRQAIGLVEAPAEDPLSVQQAKATKDSLIALQQHNVSMDQYTTAEIQKLEQVRQTYAGTEDNITDDVRRAGQA